MTEAELLALVENEERKALGYGDGELSFERAQAMKFYKGEPYGNEVEGRSQIVTTEVQDTIEWILPALLKMFTASDKVVEFSPEQPGDEKAADQATDTCNYVFYRQNNGFLALYSFFKDALLQKNGYLKVWWEESTRKTREFYQGLSDEQLTMLGKEENVKVLEHTAYDDPIDAAQRQQAMQQMGQQLQQAMMAAQQNPQAAQAAQQLQAQLQQLQAMPPKQLHDVRIEVEREANKVCVEPVAPEEILVSASHREVDPQKASFFAHRCRMRVNELEAMGYDVEGIVGDTDSYLQTSQEYQARHDLTEENTYLNTDTMDESMREVWVTEAYVVVDYEEKGTPTLRKVMKAGGKILENEEAEVIPFAAIVPIVNTHRHVGVSVADLVMDLQLIKSTITRQVLDALYLANMPRTAVLETGGTLQANLDDLLTVRPGGVVREKVPGAVRPLETPFVGGQGLQMLEYFDTVKSARTGITEQFAGLDTTDALNKTARGATIMQNNAMQRVELIARIFAETGVKALFKLILHNLVKYNTKPMTIRLTDSFVEVDPRGWDTSMDMTMNVGLGTGNKDQQLVHLQAVAQAQIGLLQMGLPVVTPQNIYNAQAKIVENAGFKNVEEFWTDPQSVPPQPPQPDPATLKLQQDQAQKQQEMQFKQQQQQADMAFEQQKFAMEQRMEALRNQAEADRARNEMAMEMMLEKFRIQAERQTEIILEHIRAQNRLEVAEISAKTTLTDPQIAAATQGVEE